MFNSQIINSDAFLDMPSSAQALYFHLGMSADDEGFVGNPKRIMKLINANDDDFKILILKRFILTFSTGIMVIKHWLVHNSIRMDRFNPTTYQDEKKMLRIKENKAYTENELFYGNQLATTGCLKLSKAKLSEPNSIVHLAVHQTDLNSSVVQPLTKFKNGKMTEEDFEKFWKIYPRKIGKGKVRGMFLKLNQSLMPKILQTVVMEKGSSQWQDPKFIPLPATWIHQERWDDELSVPTIEQEVKALMAANPKDVDQAMIEFAAKHDEKTYLEYMHLFKADF
jgi:hypothetical protein